MPHERRIVRDVPPLENTSDPEARCDSAIGMRTLTHDPRMLHVFICRGELASDSGLKAAIPVETCNQHTRDIQHHRGNPERRHIFAQDESP